MSGVDVLGRVFWGGCSGQGVLGRLSSSSGCPRKGVIGRVSQEGYLLGGCPVVLECVYQGRCPRDGVRGRVSWRSWKGYPREGFMVSWEGCSM